MEEDLAAAADGENGGMDWPVGERHTYLIEHDGQVRLLFREDNWRPFPREDNSFYCISSEKYKSIDIYVTASSKQNWK
jgi:peroxiredoxin